MASCVRAPTLQSSLSTASFRPFKRALPQALRLRARQALRYSLGALTVGEGTTATLLVRSQSNWAFRFRSRPALAPLCTLPLPGFQDFSPADPHLGLNGELQLTAFSNLLSQGAHEITALVRELYTDLSTISLWVPHAPSELHPRRAAQALGVQAQTFSGVFRKFGNLVSASIPASLASAQKEGRLRRGDRVVLCPVSAGLSFGVIDFVY